MVSKHQFPHGDTNVVEKKQSLLTAVVFISADVKTGFKLR